MKMFSNNIGTVPPDRNRLRNFIQACVGMCMVITGLAVIKSHKIISSPSGSETVVASIALIVIGSIMVWRGVGAGEKKLIKQLKIARQRLIDNGVQHTVYFSDCTIVRARPIDRIDPVENEIHFWDIATGFPRRWGPGYILICPLAIDGTQHIFKSYAIYLSKDRIENILSNKQSTTLYILPGDTNVYYFDLDFLKTW